MKRVTLIIASLVAVTLAAAFYFDVFTSREVKRDRYLKKARESVAQSKISEAIVELTNAAKIDPGSAEVHYELGLALLRRGDFQGAYREFVRATDLKPDWIQARFQLAKFYVLGKDFPNAKRQLQLIREKDPTSVESRYLAASVAIGEKNLDVAQKELEKALAKDPNRAETYIDLGGVFLAQRDFKSAEASFRKALDLDPKKQRARVALTQLYAALGDRQKAEEELLNATKEDPENENLVHLVGLFYLSTRQLDDLEKLYQGFIQKKPGSRVARKRLAELYLAKNDVKTAKRYVDDILKSDPDDTDGRFFRGRLYLTEGNNAKAIEDFSVVARKAPQFAPGFYFLGLAESMLNRIEEAKKNLAKASELLPNWIPPKLKLAQLYMTSGDYKSAFTESEDVLRTQPRNEAALFVNASARLQAGQLDKALGLFMRAREVNPKNPASYLNIGAVYMLQKKYGEARKEYEQALKLNPDIMPALNGLAEIQLISGKPKAAAELVTHHLQKTRNQAPVYHLLGQLSLGMRDYGKGIEYLEKAIDLNPNMISAYFLIGNAYAAQKQFDAAIEQYEKVIQKNPKAIPPYMVTAVLYDRKKQHQKANEYYKKILDIDKGFTPAANNLAWNYSENGGNLDVALSLAQKAREGNPNDPGIADTLGWILYKKGAVGTAIPLLKESNEKYKNSNPVVLYHLGLAYRKNGDKQLARETLTKALAVSQEFSEVGDAKKALAELNS